MIEMIYVIDFETYYKTGKNAFSLKHLSTYEYITDPRFETIMVSVMPYERGVRHQVKSFSGGRESIARFLRDSGVTDGSVVVAHNAAFDGAILEWVYGIHPSIYICTMSMAAMLGFKHAGGRSLNAVAAALGVGQKHSGMKDSGSDGKRRADFTHEQLRVYAEYCRKDVLLCADVLDQMLPRTYQSMLSHIDYTIKMFTRPKFVADIELLSLRLNTIESDKTQALHDLSEMLGVPASNVGEVLRSNDKFAELLLAHGVTPGKKPSPADPEKDTYAFAKTDKFMQDLLASDDPMIATLAECRIGERSNIEANRIARFLTAGQRLGRIPVPLMVAGAHTGRYGGADKLNMQNLPKRRGGDMTLRRSLRAPPGYKIIACDSAQIEPRVLAYVADDAVLLDAFRRGLDPYAQLAASLYSGDAAEISAKAKAGVEPFKTQRQIAKSAVIGAGYGMGASSFIAYCYTADKLVIDESTAQATINGYRQMFSSVPRLWRACNDVLLRWIAHDPVPAFAGPTGSLILTMIADWPIDGVPALQLPDQFRLFYPGLSSDFGEDGRAEMAYTDGNFRRRIYGGKLTENIVQALAFAVLKGQMSMFIDTTQSYLGGDALPVLNVHDEWVIAVPEHLAERAKNDLVKCMSTAPVWLPGIPLAAEASIGDNYAEV